MANYGVVFMSFVIHPQGVFQKLPFSYTLISKLYASSHPRAAGDPETSVVSVIDTKKGFENADWMVFSQLLMNELSRSLAHWIPASAGTRLPAVPPARE